MNCVQLKGLQMGRAVARPAPFLKSCSGLYYQSILVILKAAPHVPNALAMWIILLLCASLYFLQVLQPAPPKPMLAVQHYLAGKTGINLTFHQRMKSKLPCVLKQGVLLLWVEL